MAKPITLDYSVPELSSELASGADMHMAGTLADAIVQAVVDGGSLSRWLSDVVRMAASPDERVARSLKRAIAWHANGTGDAAAYDALERLDGTSELLEMHEGTHAETVSRLIAWAGAEPKRRADVGRFVDSAERFGADVRLAIDFLFAQLGEKPSGLGHARIHVSAAAVDALARCARNPSYGASVVERLQAESRARGQRGSDALQALVMHWAWTGEWERVDPLTAGKKLAAPVATGFASGVYNRIFDVGLGAAAQPDAAWLDAAHARLPAIAARAPKSAARVIRFATEKLARARRGP